MDLDTSLLPIDGDHIIDLKLAPSLLTPDQSTLLEYLHTLPIPVLERIIHSSVKVLNNENASLGQLCDTTHAQYRELMKKNPKLVPNGTARDNSCGVRIHCLLCPMGLFKRTTSKNNSCESCFKKYRTSGLHNTGDIDPVTRKNLEILLRTFLITDTYVLDVVEI